MTCGPGRVVGIATGRSGHRNLVGAKFSAPVQTGPGPHPASSCTMGTWSFPGVKSGLGVTLTTQTLLAPWSWKGEATPLLPVWAVRPVQSLSACTRVHFTLTMTYATVMLLILYHQQHNRTELQTLEVVTEALPSNPAILYYRSSK